MKAFITIALAFLLVACARPLPYSTVVKLEELCKGMGLEAKRYTIMNEVVNVRCVDKNGHVFSLKEEL